MISLHIQIQKTRFIVICNVPRSFEFESLGMISIMLREYIVLARE